MKEGDAKKVMFETLEYKKFGRRLFSLTLRRVQSYLGSKPFPLQDVEKKTKELQAQGKDKK